MNPPDIQKHAALLIGNQALELATARAVMEAQQQQIETLEKSLAEAKAGGSESPNGAQGANGSGTESDSSHG